MAKVVFHLKDPPLLEVAAILGAHLAEEEEVLDFDVDGTYLAPGNFSSLAYLLEDDENLHSLYLLECLVCWH